MKSSSILVFTLINLIVNVTYLKAKYVVTCKDNPCHNGKCIDSRSSVAKWPQYICECDPDFTGQKCDKIKEKTNPTPKTSTSILNDNEINKNKEDFNENINKNNKLKENESLKSDSVTDCDNKECELTLGEKIKKYIQNNHDYFLASMFGVALGTLAIIALIILCTKRYIDKRKTQTGKSSNRKDLSKNKNNFEERKKLNP